MNAREFMRANMGMLLTLPGAALWSMPVGYSLFTMFNVWASLPFTLGWVEWSRYLAIPLLPISCVCSFVAMEHYASARSQYGVSALLMLFNLVTGFLSGFGTVLLIYFLVSTVSDH